MFDLPWLEQGVSLKYLGKPQNRSQRCTNFVTHVGDKLAHGQTGFFGRLASEPVLLSLLVVGDIAYHDAVCERTVSILCDDRLQPRPEWRSVIFHQPQIAYPPRTLING